METEQDEIAYTAMNEITETARQHGKNTVYREPVYRGSRQTRFTESRETVTLYRDCTVHREPRDCNMYRDCTSSPRAKRL